MTFLQTAELSALQKFGVVKPKTRQNHRLKFNIKILLTFLSIASGVKGKFVGVNISNLQA
jgi:hypothetical protein